MLRKMYPKVKLSGLIREEPVNASPVEQYVFLADFGDDFTSEVFVNHDAFGGWHTFVPQYPTYA
jgi:hypothetical protein